MGSCLGRQMQSRDGDYRRMPTSDSDHGVDPPPPYEYAAAPEISQAQRAHRRILDMTDEERFQFARRKTLLQMLPVGTYGEDKGEKQRECVICFVEFAVGDPIRLLPCMHLYHLKCIDDWLNRSFSCPTCLEDMEKILSAVLRTQDA